MFIFTSTNKRANPEASFISDDGTRYAKIPRELLTEIPDPTPPADYSDETYYRTEQDESPYVIYTRKSAEQIAAVRWNKLKQLRDSKRFEGGVKVGDNWFRTDAIATGEYTALNILGAGLPDTTVLRANWRTMSGALVDMTPALVKQILFAGFAQVAALDDVSQTKRLDDTDVNVGWPEVYVEPQP